MTTSKSKSDKKIINPMENNPAAPQPEMPAEKAAPALPVSKKILALLGLLLIAAVAGLYFYSPKEPVVPRPAFNQNYRLVPEKISQSATIKISLPPKLNFTDAENRIKFNPEIQGAWVKSGSETELIFKPAEKLTLNRYYSVNLMTPDNGRIYADFLATDDPSIVAIFPAKDSETPENSEVTIIFNRPMVPLTTLGYLEAKDIPVEILPATEGRWKWITTKNLQFIPKERLQRSSNYKVTIKPGMVSADGLSLNEAESTFTTRHLRYTGISQDQVIYNRPISIYFNQPVDLEKTKKEIILKNAKQENIPFAVKYKKEEKSVNQSVLEIYNSKDRFNRPELWDFETGYSLEIARAYPLEGDIDLNEKKTTSVYVTTAIKNISAASERTSYSELNFFDPKGKIATSFYEDIDLRKSVVTAPYLDKIIYGEKCQEEDISPDSGSPDCTKITDKQKIYITLKSDRVGLGEKMNLVFEKIVNATGLIVNKEPIQYSIVAYPKFAIIKTDPPASARGASVTELRLCSNTPIRPPGEEEYKDYLKASLEYEMHYWGGSQKVYSANDSKYLKCAVGEFSTYVGYGLIPNAGYSLDLAPADVFGQKLKYSFSFTTGDMPSRSLSFYQLQNNYSVTAPDKTKLTYAAQNFEYVDLEICKMNPLDFLKILDNKPGRMDPPDVIKNCAKISDKQIDLPGRYWFKNYFNIDIKDYFPDPIGHYVLSISNPNYKTSYWNNGATIQKQVYERTYLSVTNMHLAEKRINLRTAAWGNNKPLREEEAKNLSNLYWVTNLATLDPVPGAKISLYKKNGNDFALSGSSSTNDQGVSSPSAVYDLEAVVATKGNDSALIPSRDSKLNYGDPAFSAYKIYLYTDKPIYRPEQEVFMKGLYRIGYDGSYEIFRDKKINVKVFNSKDDEISGQDLDISDYGTFDTKILLDKDAPLGTYRVCAEQTSCAQFEVQEYVPAAFKVEVKTDKEEYISKDTVNADIAADYYFGVPLESGEAAYTVSSQNYYFDRYSDGSFGFDSGWYYDSPYSYGEKFLLRGSASLSKDGKAKISLPLDIEKLFKNKDDRKSKIIVLDVTVKNSNGQSISAQKSFILHAGEFYLGIASDKYFAAKNEPIALKIKSVDTAGKPISEQNLTLNLYSVDWVYSKRQEATGGYSYDWEKQRKLVNSFDFATDNAGAYSRTVKLAEEGQYEAEALGQDRRSNEVGKILDLYIYGSREVSIQPRTDTTLELDAQKTSLSIGDKGEFIIKSPYPKSKALISIERGKIFTYEIKDIEGSLFPYSFDIKEEYSPNIFVSVLLISPKPEIKFGQAEFKIGTERSALNIEVKSNKNFYLPGEEVILDVSTKNYEGKGISAEISTAVVDLSVLALQGNPKKNPLVFFYGGFPLTVSTASNVKDILIETSIPTKGGGGGNEEELAKKKRGIFKETALWSAAVKTDASGQAQIKFTLPDNLTSWQAETVGITQDTKLGVNYTEFTTRKNLMAVPLKPRFVVPGDNFYVGATIFNQSGINQNVSVKFSSGTLKLKESSAEKAISINKNESYTVYFNVEAPDSIETGKHMFVLAAKGLGAEDTVEQTINITPNDTYETTATSDYTTESSAKEYIFLPDDIIKTKGTLTVKNSATLAVFLTDALNYLLGYPYGCSEQISSKLDSIAIIKKGLNIPNVGDKFNIKKISYNGTDYTIDELIDIGLAKLYNNQRTDGGFALWPNSEESSFYATLHVTDTLNNLKKAGVTINQNAIDRAANYLYGKITTDYNYYNDRNTIVLTAYTLYSLDNFKDNNGALKQKINDLVKDDLFLNDQISNTSLAYLGIITANNFSGSVKQKVLNTLDNRINIDARGAFLETNKNFLWYYYETPIKNTALYLKVQAATKSKNPLTEKALRWLLASRQKDGSWGSTNNNVTVIDALTDYLVWKKETESNFVLSLLLNDKKIDAYDYNPATILDQNKKVLPLQDLKFNENNLIVLSKENKNNLPNNFYYDMALKYYLPQDQIQSRDEGFSITREFYSQNDVKNEKPLTEAMVGDVIREHITVTVPATRKFVAIEDYIPAGMEIVNMDLATEQKSLRLRENELTGREFYPTFKELRDDRTFLYTENLNPGVYEYDYYVRALIKGKFTRLPAIASEMYFPENFGRTAGGYFEIK